MEEINGALNEKYEALKSILSEMGSVVVAMSPRVGHARPALLQPSVLWDAERLTVSPPPR